MSRQENKEGGPEGRQHRQGFTVSGRNVIVTGTGRGTTVIQSSAHPKVTSCSAKEFFDSCDSDDSDDSPGEDSPTVVHTVTGSAVIGNIGDVRGGAVRNITATHLGPMVAGQQQQQGGSSGSSGGGFPKEDFSSWLQERGVREDAVAQLLEEGFDSFKTFACMEEGDVEELGVSKGQCRLLRSLAREVRGMKQGGAHSKKTYILDGENSDGGIVVQNSRMILQNVQGGEVSMVNVKGYGGGERRVTRSTFHGPVVAGVMGNVNAPVSSIVVGSNCSQGDTVGVMGKTTARVGSTTIWQGALSDENLSHLSQNLSGEWPHFLVKLGVPYTRVEQARSDHRSTSHCILSLLLSWRQSCKEQPDKMVDRLLSSLTELDRRDLSLDLQQRHLHSQESAAPPAPAPSSQGHSQGQSSPPPLYQSAQPGTPPDYSHPVPPSQPDPSPQASLHPPSSHTPLRPSSLESTAMAETQPMEQDGV